MRRVLSAFFGREVHYEARLISRLWENYGRERDNEARSILPPLGKTGRNEA